MISKKYKDMLSNKSIIRQFSEFAIARGAQIGYENVFDYRSEERRVGKECRL